MKKAKIILKVEIDEPAYDEDLNAAAQSLCKGLEFIHPELKAKVIALVVERIQRTTLKDGDE